MCDVFNAIKGFQLIKINTSFPEQTMELFTLSSALDPIDKFNLFDRDRICCRAEKFYPHDSTANEILVWEENWDIINLMRILIHFFRKLFHFPIYVDN